MAQVLIFTDFEFTKRDYERFGIQLMRDSGIDVFVFDMSSIYFSNLKRRQAHTFGGYYDITSYQYFCEVFDRVAKDGYCILAMPLTFKLWPYFRKIWKSPLRITTLRLGALPSIGQKPEKNLFKILGYFFKPLEATRLFERFLLNRVSNFLGIQKKPALYMCAGQKVESMFPSSLVLSCGSFDFNIFSRTPPTNVQKHLVFLDEYQPFHPDFDRLGVKKISAKNYFRDLNQFFSLLEKRHQLPVVIAAHPASDLETYKSYFEGRMVIKGETAALVRDSFGVLGHTSTAIQMAFLYEKPTCFFVTEEMSQGFYEPMLKAYRDYGFYFYNISLDEDLLKAHLSLDEKLAKKYINDFVISEGTPRVNSWERLIQYIKDEKRRVYDAQS